MKLCLGFKVCSYVKFNRHQFMHMKYLQQKKIFEKLSTLFIFLSDSLHGLDGRTGTRLPSGPNVHTKVSSAEGIFPV